MRLRASDSAAWATTIVTSRKGGTDQFPGPRAGGRDRRRHHRLQRRLPPGAGRLARRAAGREGPADQRLDLPRRRPGHPVQPVADDDAVPPLQRRAVPRAGRVRHGSAACASPPARRAWWSCGGAPAGPAASAWTSRCCRRTRRSSVMPPASRRRSVRRASGSARTAASTRTPPPTRWPTPPATWARGSRTNTRVTGIELDDRRRGAAPCSPSGGRIETEHVVNACGIWAPQVSAMVGAFTPSVPVDHQHIALHGGGRPRAAARHALLPRHRQPRLRPLRGGRRAVRRLRARTRSRAGWTACRGSHAAANLPADEQRFAQLWSGAARRFPFLEDAGMVTLECHPTR